MSFTRFVILVLLPQQLFCLGERLVLTSDSPAIRGAPVTFMAQLENPFYNEYTIVFQENYPYSQYNKTTLASLNDFRANWTLAYENAKPAGTYTITVTVTYKFLVEIPVAWGLCTYEITRNFTGELEVHQPGVPRKQPLSVSTLNETELSLKIHDPSNYLDTALDVKYTWILNNTVLANFSSSILNMNFTKEFTYPVTVNVTAIFNETGKPIIKYGSFSQNISAKVPIVNFTVNGATWFRHGKLLDLTVTCDGTPPYEYCWMFKYGPYNHTGNETCEPTVTTDCTIHISRYFEAGTYNLIMLINNDVGKILNQTGIHVYKTTRKPQLSVIIVPISFTLVAIVLVIFGVAYYWENHMKYSVEVADFDFGQFEESQYVRFLDRLRDAVSTSMRLRAGSGRDPLISADSDSNVYDYGATNNDPKF